MAEPLTKHPLYSTWCCMRNRCHRPGFDSYPYYGGRGIIVCDDWRYSFESFRDWATANGWELGLSLDRFPDVNGNYCPENCRWVTHKEQCRNKRNTMFVEIDGVTKSTGEWAEIYGLDTRTLMGRIRKYGWDPVRAITTPSRNKNGRRK